MSDKTRREWRVFWTDIDMDELFATHEDAQEWRERFPHDPAVISFRDVVTTKGQWEDVRPCPYTHSHTRHWCGHEQCRDA